MPKTEIATVPFFPSPVTSDVERNPQTHPARFHREQFARFAIPYPTITDWHPGTHRFHRRAAAIARPSGGARSLSAAPGVIDSGGWLRFALSRSRHGI